MEESKGSYGKRPWWHWLLIYLVVGGLVYAGIYYFYMGGKGYGSAGGSENSTPYGQ